MAAYEARVEGGRYSVPTRWLLMSYLPRNNFYAHAYPQPMTQGCGWDWSEYWWWEDAATPKQWLYRHFTVPPQRPGLEHQPGLFRGHRDRAARGPGDHDGDRHALFREFPGETGPAGLEGVVRGISPGLCTPGRNRLEMRVRNNAGVLGPVSFLEVEK